MTHFAPPVEVTRAQVLAYRLAVQASAGAALDAGVQDHPVGRSAGLALRLRRSDPGHDGSVLVHSVRAAMHRHHGADLGTLAAALRIDHGTDLAKPSIGQFGIEVETAGLGFGAATDLVAETMRSVMADGRARTKGELSGAVTPHVDPRVAPWCEGCGVHHVQDALFRYATLQAGLTIDVESPRAFRFVPPIAIERPDRRVARGRLVRSFLRLAGPVRPSVLADWLALTPSAARGWWAVGSDALVPVGVGGARRWMHGDDVAVLVDAPDPPPVRLLGPYDPFTEIGDRELLVPDRSARRAVWSAAANPGVVVVGGEIAGVWRRRQAAGSLTLTVRPTRLGPNAPIAPTRLDDLLRSDAAAGDLAAIRDDAGVTQVTVVVSP